MTKSEKAFIELMESGTYSQLKKAETFLKQAKQELRQLLEYHEGKRFEFKNSGMVAKFIAKKIYETNHAGIIEELFCYVKPEIALDLLSLDDKKLKEDNIQLNDFLLPPTYYIRPSLNKNGKKLVQQTDFLFGGQTEEELIAKIKEVTNEKRGLEEKYEAFKKVCMSCIELKTKKKVATPYGSVSLVQNKSKWDLQGVFEAMGDTIFIHYGKVDMSKLDEYILYGVIPSSIVSEHRKVVDIRIDFIVTDKENEEKAMQFHRDRLVHASLQKLA